MTRYLLDTNVLLHMVNKSEGHEKISQRLAIENPDRVKISAITVWEISRMVEKAKSPAKVQPKIDAVRAAMAMMVMFDVEGMDPRSAALGGNVHAWLANKGQVIGERDSMIGGIAMIHDYILVTDNTKDFVNMPGLALENWRT